MRISYYYSIISDSFYHFLIVNVPDTASHILFINVNCEFFTRIFRENKKILINMTTTFIYILI